MFSVLIFDIYLVVTLNFLSCQVRAPLSAGYVMFVPQYIVGYTRLIIQLLNVTSGRDDSTSPSDIGTMRDEGYLLLICCDAGTDRIATCPVWKGQDVIVEPTAETAIALSHIQVTLVCINRNHNQSMQNIKWHKSMTYSGFVQVRENGKSQGNSEKVFQSLESQGI